MYRTGRRIIERLPEGEDLFKSIGAICSENRIQLAFFSLTGTVRSATLGIYDQKLRVYITRKEEGPFEVLCCSGNLSMKEKKPALHAKIILADETNRVFGGHLFSDTISFYAELNMEEIEGPLLEREYDDLTGLYLWPTHKNRLPFLSI